MRKHAGVRGDWCLGWMSMVLLTFGMLRADTPVDGGSPLLPVPAAAEQTDARATVREVFGDRLKGPAADRAKVVEEMLKQAQEPGNSPAVRFVLLSQASEAAAGVGDVALALRAVDTLAESFQIDRWPTVVQVVDAAVKAPPNATTAAAAVGAVRSQADDAAAQDRFDDAQKLLRAAETFAVRAKDTQALADVRARTADLRLVAAEFERTRVATTTLKTKPDDPQANEVVGLYLASTKGDWEKGLPHLAKSADPTIKQLAALDLATPADAPARKALGDRWWAAAEKRPPSVRAGMQRRAAQWYALSLDGVTGLERAVVEKRIAEASAGPAPARGGSAPRTVDLLSMVDPARDAVAGQWSLAKNVLSVKDGEFTRLQFPYAPPEEYDYRIDFVYTTKGGPVMQSCPPGSSAGGITWWMEFNKNAINGNGTKAAGKPPLIERNKLYSSVVKVRKTKVQAFLNGALVAEVERGPAGGGGASGPWKLRDPQRLGLAVWASDTTFSKIEVVEISGPGKRLK